MDTYESPELWHQLSNETPRSHEAFKVFMYMSPAERSVVGAWREWTGNPEAVRPSPFFKEWSQNHAWAERARAHDRHVELLREQGMEEAIKEEAARQAKQVEQRRFRYNELMAMAYERAMQYLEDDELTRHLRPADVVQIMKMHLETTHKLGGEGADGSPEAMVDWSEDEQRELDQLLGEIDAEVAQEEPEEGSEEGEEDSGQSEDAQD